MADLPVLKIQPNPDSPHGYEVSMLVGGNNIATRCSEIRLEGKAGSGWKAELVFSAGSFTLHSETRVGYDNLTMTFPDGSRYKIVPAEGEN